jgi:hypothetical protein
VPNLTIALTKDTSAYRCHIPKSYDGCGGPGESGDDRQYSCCISPCSHAFCLDAIEETYKKDFPLAIYLKNFPCDARNVVKNRLCLCPQADQRLRPDRCLRLFTYLCFLPVIEEAYNKDPSLVNLKIQIHVLPVTFVFKNTVARAPQPS